MISVPVHVCAVCWMQSFDNSTAWCLKCSSYFTPQHYSLQTHVSPAIKNEAISVKSFVERCKTQTSPSFVYSTNSYAIMINDPILSSWGFRTPIAHQPTNKCAKPKDASQNLNETVLAFSECFNGLNCKLILILVLTAFKFTHYFCYARYAKVVSLNHIRFSVYIKLNWLDFFNIIVIIFSHPIHPL